MQAILPDCAKCAGHDDVIKWKHFPHYWPFVRGIHRSPVNSPHKGQWRGAFMISLICARINGWVNNGKAGDLRRHRAHYDVTVMFSESVRRHLLAKRHKIAQIISTNNTSAILRNSGSIHDFIKLFVTWRYIMHMSQLFDFVLPDTLSKFKFLVTIEVNSGFEISCSCECVISWRLWCVLCW